MNKSVFLNHLRKAKDIIYRKKVLSPVHFRIFFSNVKFAYHAIIAHIRQTVLQSYLLLAYYASRATEKPNGSLSIHVRVPIFRSLGPYTGVALLLR